MKNEQYNNANKSEIREQTDEIKEQTDDRKQGRVAEKIVSVLLPIGLLMLTVYLIINHYVEVPDEIAYPWMIISIVLELVGVFYNGRCLGLRKSPYDVWNKN